MQVPKSARKLQPARALTTWLIAAITALAIGAVWFVAYSARSSTDFDASLTIGFFVPMVASALCIEVLSREAWANNRRVSKLAFWLWLAVMPIGVFAAAAYHVASLPVSYRGSGSGVWWGMLLMEVLGLGFSALLWFFVVLPLGMLLPLIGKVLRGKAHPRALSVGLIMLSLAGIIVTTASAFDFAGSGSRARGSVVLAILGAPGNYWVENEVAAWVCRLLVVLVVVLVIDGIVAARRERSAAPVATPTRADAADTETAAPPPATPEPAPATPEPAPTKRKRTRRKLRREPSVLDVFDEPVASADDAELPPGAPEPRF